MTAGPIHSTWVGTDRCSPYLSLPTRSSARGSPDTRVRSTHLTTGRWCVLSPSVTQHAMSTQAERWVGGCVCVCVVFCVCVCVCVVFNYYNLCVCVWRVCRIQICWVQSWWYVRLLRLVKQKGLRKSWNCRKLASWCAKLMLCWVTLYVVAVCVLQTCLPLWVFPISHRENSLLYDLRPRKKRKKSTILLFFDLVLLLFGNKTDQMLFPVGSCMHIYCMHFMRKVSATCWKRKAVEASSAGTTTTSAKHGSSQKFLEEHKIQRCCWVCLWTFVHNVLLSLPVDVRTQRVVESACWRSYTRCVLLPDVGTEMFQVFWEILQVFVVVFLEHTRKKCCNGWRGVVLWCCGV